ncbi:toxic anion resistance protein [Orenia marismortui]|uniref:toxic anion resistance protein n=1 Tax=Orenia marismortui TaxID=46469 RepID=UPI000380C251|nr:toxic anion resistance protein [Orenia marismortui]
MSNDFSLILPEDRELKEKIEEENSVPKEELTELEKQSEDFIESLLMLNDKEVEERDIAISNIDKLGIDVQKESSLNSAKLKTSVQSISAKSSDGERVANSLLELKSTVEDLDPSDIDFTKRSKGIFKIFNPVNKYFDKYKSSEEIINKIIESLEKSKGILKRDNITLTYDQEDMYNLTKRLSKYIEMGNYIDKRLSVEIESIRDEDKRKFLMEEIQFPLRQRVMDLQQQQSINQQGIFAIEIIKKNNKELIRGIDRAKMVTVNALEIAIIVSQALADQKLVLDKINALNAATNNLIAGTAEKLKEQGIEIQKQASSSMLEADKLKEAFKDINDAMDEITSFRLKSLPKMKESIEEFNELITAGEEKIKGFAKAKNINLLDEDKIDNKKVNN